MAHDDHDPCRRGGARDDEPSDRPSGDGRGGASSGGNQSGTQHPTRLRDRADLKHRVGPGTSNKVEDQTGSALIEDSGDDQATAVHGQARVTMGHEGLPGVRNFRPSELEVRPSPHVNNLRGHHLWTRTRLEGLVCHFRWVRSSNRSAAASGSPSSAFPRSGRSGTPTNAMMLSLLSGRSDPCQSSDYPADG